MLHFKHSLHSYYFHTGQRPFIVVKEFQPGFQAMYNVKKINKILLVKLRAFNDNMKRLYFVTIHNIKIERIQRKASRQLSQFKLSRHICCHIVVTMPLFLKSFIDYFVTSYDYKQWKRAKFKKLHLCFPIQIHCFTIWVFVLRFRYHKSTIHTHISPAIYNIIFTFLLSIHYKKFPHWKQLCFANQFVLM